MAKGNFIEYVVSDNPNKYPNDGEQNGYYYETVEDVTPEVIAQTPVIAQILEGLVGKAQGANATADKILEGYSAYVGGVLVDGTYAPIDIAELFGCTNVAVDKITFTEASTAPLFYHSLGTNPKIAIAYTDGIVKGSNTNNYNVFNMAILKNEANYYGGSVVQGINSSGACTIKSTISNLVFCQPEYVRFFNDGSYKNMTGVEYTLITMA